MIEFLKPTSTELLELKQPEKNIWINLVHPDEKEVVELSKILDLKVQDFEDLKLDIESISDDDEIPIYEKKDNGFIFMIIKTPQDSTGSLNQDYVTVPLGIIITKDYVVTIVSKKNTVINRMKQKTFAFDRIYFTLRLLLVTSRSYLYFLKEVNRRLKKIEHSLELDQNNKEIADLLDIQKSLVYFNTSIINNQILFEKIFRTSMFIKSKKNKEIIDDLLDENRQAMQTTQIYSDNITHTLTVVSSIISNNLNRIVKFLTSVSIVIAIPTLVASLYGMNVPLPLQTNPKAFILVLTISVIVSVLIGVFLWKRKLF